MMWEGVRALKERENTRRPQAREEEMMNELTYLTEIQFERK